MFLVGVVDYNIVITVMYITTKPTGQLKVGNEFSKQ